MLNARLFKFWHDLPEALRTGQPQNETKDGGKGSSKSSTPTLPKLEQFLGAMTGSRGSISNFRGKVRLLRFQTLCDVGGATGLLAWKSQAASTYEVRVSFDLPSVEPVAPEGDRSRRPERRRSRRRSGDFFKDPLPKADVITMGMILHDWNLEKKMHLIRAAYEALPPGGAFVAIEALIDDARRVNASAC